MTWGHYDAERAEANRLFAETGIIVNHWAARDVLMGCIGERRAFPDVLVEFLAGSHTDAHGNPLDPAEHADLLASYHRQGRLSDAQWRRALAAHPELNGLAMASARPTSRPVAKAPSTSTRPSTWTGRAVSRQRAARLRAALDQQPEAAEIAAAALKVRPVDVDAIAAGRVLLTTSQWQRLWRALEEQR